MKSSLQILLLQIRNQEDPIRLQEIDCFAELCDVAHDQIQVVNLLNEVLKAEFLAQIDVAFIGGSGDYSVTAEEPWLYRALDSIRTLYDSRVPTFASCWGFQAVSRALGGKVVHDLSRAELGTEPAFLTAAGKQDELFSSLPEQFNCYMGHEDIVDAIPENAILLASTERVAHQAFTFPDRLFYATQFHPELKRETLLDRARNYSRYVEKIAGIPWEAFEAEVEEAIETEQLIPRFMQMVKSGSHLPPEELEPRS